MLCLKYDIFWQYDVCAMSQQTRIVHRDLSVIEQFSFQIKRTASPLGCILEAAHHRFDWALAERHAQLLSRINL